MREFMDSVIEEAKNPEYQRWMEKILAEHSQREGKQTE